MIPVRALRHIMLIMILMEMDRMNYFLDGIGSLREQLNSPLFIMIITVLLIIWHKVMLRQLVVIEKLQIFIQMERLLQLSGCQQELKWKTLNIN